jgi:hypothetical protein
LASVISGEITSRINKISSFNHVWGKIHVIYFNDSFQKDQNLKEKLNDLNFAGK